MKTGVSVFKKEKMRKEKERDVLVEGREFLWTWAAGADVVIRYAITQVPFTPSCVC